MPWPDGNFSRISLDAPGDLQVPSSREVLIAQLDTRIRLSGFRPGTSQGPSKDNGHLGGGPPVRLVGRLPLRFHSRQPGSLHQRPARFSSSSSTALRRDKQVDECQGPGFERCSLSASPPTPPPVLSNVSHPLPVHQATPCTSVHAYAQADEILAFRIWREHRSDQLVLCNSPRISARRSKIRLVDRPPLVRYRAHHRDTAAGVRRAMIHQDPVSLSSRTAVGHQTPASWSFPRMHQKVYTPQPTLAPRLASRSCTAYLGCCSNCSGRTIVGEETRLTWREAKSYGSGQKAVSQAGLFESAPLANA